LQILYIFFLKKIQLALKRWQHIAGDNDYWRVNWYEPTLSPKSTWATNTKLLMALSTTSSLLRVVVGCRRSGPCIYTQNGGLINGFLYWSPPCWADGAVLEYKWSILWSFLIQDSYCFSESEIINYLCFLIWSNITAANVLNMNIQYIFFTDTLLINYARFKSLPTVIL
jgi:hypothetical protein